MDSVYGHGHLIMLLIWCHQDGPVIDNGDTLLGGILLDPSVELVDSGEPGLPSYPQLRRAGTWDLRIPTGELSREWA